MKACFTDYFFHLSENALKVAANQLASCLPNIRLIWLLQQSLMSFCCVPTVFPALLILTAEPEGTQHWIGEAADYCAKTVYIVFMSLRKCGCPFTSPAAAINTV